MVKVHWNNEKGMDGGGKITSVQETLGDVELC